MDGYCVKCKKSVQIKAAKFMTTTNGRRAAFGSCPTCGTKVMRFIKK